MTYSLEEIRQAVIKVTKIDPLTKSRKAQHVQTKALFSAYARKERYTYTAIAEFLVSHHATILYYNKINFFFDTPDTLYYARHESLFEEVKAILDPIYRASIVSMNKILKREIEDLNRKISFYEKSDEKYARLNRSLSMNRALTVGAPVFARIEDAVEDVINNRWRPSIRSYEQ